VVSSRTFWQRGVLTLDAGSRPPGYSVRATNASGRGLWALLDILNIPTVAAQNARGTAHRVSVAQATPTLAGAWIGAGARASPVVGSVSTKALPRHSRHGVQPPTWACPPFPYRHALRGISAAVVLAHMLQTCFNARDLRTTICHGRWFP